VWYAASVGIFQRPFALRAIDQAGQHCLEENRSI